MTRPLAITGLLGLAYVGLALLGTAWGTVPIPPGHVIGILTTVEGRDIGHAIPATERFLVLQVRLPQVLLLGLIGAALACSGAALQTTFENPLADPGVLGVSGGAALGAVLAIHTGLAEVVFLSLPLCAFFGGLAACLAVYSLSYVGGRPTGHTLLLTGVAVGSMAIAGVSLVMVLTEVYRVQELLFWLVGGVRNQTWEHVWLSLPPITLGIAGLLCLHRRLDALLLGEEQALAVGVPVVRTRLWILVLTALATGAATAVGGSIGFVGLMVPHLIRRLLGPRTLHLLPGCIAGGAAFLAACDLLARALSGRYTLHLGILTALLGGPTFLFILRDQGRPALIVPLPLQAEQVTVKAGGRALLDQVSLTLTPGSMTVLLGPNGAGKTTLMRVLAGLLPATSGTVLLGGERLHDLGRLAIARQCAYLPQQTGTVFEMRVEDVVMLGRYPHAGRWGGLTRTDYERVAWALERVGLASLRRRTLPTLSGGELQRVFLGRALAQEAPILLLDEPISALDVGRQLELMALLNDLNRDGHTILAALHDLRPALEFFPLAVLLNAGRLAAVGPTEAVVLGQALESAFGVRVRPGEGFRLCSINEIPRTPS